MQRGGPTQVSLDPRRCGARRSGTGGGLEAEGEDIEVLEVTIDKAVEWIASGEIVDAKTIILVQHAQLCLFGI